MFSPHRVWTEIDLGALRHNLRAIRRLAGAAQVWPVLKADAYGHGAAAVAAVCALEGVQRIGVGDSGEALKLRETGLQLPILVLGTVIDAEVDDLLFHDVEVGVHSESRARKLGAAARRAARRLGVHLKIDTGMARLGVRPEAALRVARAILAEPFLELRGVMTHYAAVSGFHDPFTGHQQAQFVATLEELRAAGVQVSLVHCANSAALFTGAKLLGDAVRCGIALYGILPFEAPGAARLRPVLSLRAQLVFLKDVPAGTPVGYGGRWVAHRATRLAVLPVGYNHGVPYRLGAEGRGTVLVRGRRCPIVGAVSMDYCTIDVGHAPGVRVGDLATLIGEDGAEALTVQEVAGAAGTIPYEITCAVGARVPRVFREETRPAPAASSGS